MIYTVGSFIIAFAALCGTFLISTGRRWGWVYLACMQAPNVAYDCYTRQYGFVLTCSVASVLYWRGFLRLGHLTHNQELRELLDSGQQ